MFITFEGSEGSGKTSQILPLERTLKDAGYNVLTTREPGGTPIGDRVREILFDFKNTDMHPRTEILLFQASRAQHVEQIIKPYLEKGGVVICDRYADSTLAYQGYGYQQDIEQLRDLVNFATCGLRPDLTIFVDVDVEVGLRRRVLAGKLNRLDAYTVAFYERVRQGYYELLRLDPERWVIIDGNRSFEQVRVDIYQVVLERLQQASSYRE
ncbi:MAG: dTMP kinase [Chloroflexi bacterium]|nr:MAG: dTMP kinase [Chloroflexota bacterium]